MPDGRHPYADDHPLPSSLRVDRLCQLPRSRERRLRNPDAPALAVGRLYSGQARPEEDHPVGPGPQRCHRPRGGGTDRYRPRPLEPSAGRFDSPGWSVGVHDAGAPGDHPGGRRPEEPDERPGSERGGHERGGHGIAGHSWVHARVRRARGRLLRGCGPEFHSDDLHDHGQLRQEQHRSGRRVYGGRRHKARGRTERLGGGGDRTGAVVHPEQRGATPPLDGRVRAHILLRPTAPPACRTSSSSCTGWSPQG